MNMTQVTSYNQADIFSLRPIFGTLGPDFVLQSGKPRRLEKICTNNAANESKARNWAPGRSCDQKPGWVETKDLSSWQQGHIQKSELENRAGQTWNKLSVRAEKWGQKNQTRSQPTNVPLPHRLQGTFLRESRWNSAGCLVTAPAGSGSHLLLMHRDFQMAFDVLWFSIFWMHLKQIHKAFLFARTSLRWPRL